MKIDIKITNKRSISRFNSLADEFFLAHGDRYSYSDAIYKGITIKISIACKKHGHFMQTPKAHAFGQGCPACNGTSKPSTEEFISSSMDVHGNRYDYSNTVYGRNNKTEVSIRCRKHGIFKQIPNNHLLGSGCPACAELTCLTAITGASRMESFRVYYVKIDDVYKIGITSQSLNKRLYGNKFTLIYISDTMRLADAFEIEQKIIRRYSRWKSNKSVMRNGKGNHELFKLNIFKRNPFN